MFKKSDEINDLNDISLVNPEGEKRSLTYLAGKIMSDTVNNIVCLLLISLTDNFSLIFIGKEHNLNDFINLQFSITLIYLIALCFSTGVINILASYGKLRKLYFESFSLIFLFVLFIYLPLVLIGFFCSSNEIWSNFIIYSPTYLLFKFLVFLNLKTLEIRKLYYIINIFCVILCLLNITLCYVFTVLIELHITGIILALNISYFIGMIISFFLIKHYSRVLEHSQATTNSTQLTEEKGIFLSIYHNASNAIYELLHAKQVNNDNSNKTNQDIFTFTNENLNLNKNTQISAERRHSKQSIHNIKNEHYINNDVENINAISREKRESIRNNFNINERSPPIISNKNSNINEPREFTISLLFNSFETVFKMSILSALNYFGFALIIIFGAFIESPNEAASNVILMNIFIIPFLICFSFSITLTNYISLESFTHSHANKYKFAKLCIGLLFIVTVILSLCFFFFSKEISELYYYDNIITQNVQIVLNLYAFFIFPHFASIMLDGFIMTSSEHNNITYYLAGVFSFFIVPFSLILYRYFQFSFLICWYAIFGYNIIHLLTLIFYMFGQKILS